MMRITKLQLETAMVFSKNMHEDTMCPDLVDAATKAARAYERGGNSMLTEFWDQIASLCAYLEVPDLTKRLVVVDGEDEIEVRPFWPREYDETGAPLPDDESCESEHDPYAVFAWDEPIGERLY